MKTTLTIMALALATTASAQENPLWLRHCAISPDGSTVAFAYKGDIYTVPATGGNARQQQLTPPTTPIPCGAQTANSWPFALIAREVWTCM